MRRVVPFGILLGGYTAMLQWGFEAKVSQYYSSIGVSYREPETLGLVVAFVLVLVVGLMLPRTLVNPSDFIVWMLYAVMLVPSVMVPQYTDLLTGSASLELAVVGSASFAVLALLGDRGPRDLLPRISVPPVLLWVVVGLVTVVTYGYMLTVTGLSLRYISLTGVRDTRLAYIELVGAGAPGLAYLLGIQGNVLNPLLIVRGIVQRRWLLVAAGVVGQALIYSATGYKMIILSIPAALILPVLFRGNRGRSGWLIVAGSAAVTAASLLYDHLRDSYTVTLIFVGRLLLLPGALVAAHVEFFHEREKGYWAYSFLSPFVSYAYDRPPAALVGMALNGDPHHYANANYIGDGFDNWGYLGVFVEVVVLVLLLWAVNSAARDLPPLSAAALLVVPTLLLANTSAFTSILTGGFAACILVLLVLPRSGWTRKPAPPIRPPRPHHVHSGNV